MTKNTTKTFINMDKKCRKNNKSTASKSTDKSEWSELEYGWVKKVSNILCVVISLGTYRQFSPLTDRQALFKRNRISLLKLGTTLHVIHVRNIILNELIWSKGNDTISIELLLNPSWDVMMVYFSLELQIFIFFLEQTSLMKRCQLLLPSNSV